MSPLVIAWPVKAQEPVNLLTKGSSPSAQVVSGYFTNQFTIFLLSAKAFSDYVEL